MTDANELKAALQRELDMLTKARDELRLRIHLAKADAREEWKKLETTWMRTQEELKRTTEHTKEPVKDMGLAVKNLIDELKGGYTRIKDQLKDPHPPNA